NRRRNLLDLISDYRLAGRERCFQVRPDSPLVGKSRPILFLIVGMMPFAFALQKTAGIDLAVDGLLRLFGGREPRLLLAILFVMTALIGLFISSTATAILMAPVALSAAHHLKASPYPFAMIVALAASAAFMTPISSPVNTLVLGPGQ